MSKLNVQNEFYTLNPDSLLDCVEAELAGDLEDIRATGRTIALNSLENRVYEIELENETSVVAKFYRPQRWTKAQILEEHQFLLALQKNEIPVIAPLQLQSGTLATTPSGIFFALFPKVKGRILDELSKSQLSTLGRYLARIHITGKTLPFRHRLKLDIPTYGDASLAYLEDHIDISYLRPYREVAEKIFSASRKMLTAFPAFSVHGDCHLGNTLWQGESPFFLDFDDSLTAPAVQDVWMIVRGRDSQALSDRDELLSGYETFLPFPRDSLGLIESLRALRMIHYSAWIGKRWQDPAFPHAFPDFQSSRYWQEELYMLEEVLDIIENPQQAEYL